MCQFKNNSGIQCGHHRNSDFPIQFSQSLQMYLCQQHERMIIDDHLQKFIRNKVKHQLLTYSTFSQNIRNRFIPNIRHIPEELQLDQCLYKFNIQQLYCANMVNSFNIIIKVQLDNYFVTENGSIHQLAFNNNNIYEIRIINNSMNISIENVRERLNVIDVLHYPRIPEPQIMNDISQIISDDNYNIEEHISMNRRQIYQVLNQYMGILSNYQQVNPSINPNNELELINVTSCNICMNETIQKGFKMTCCNQDIQVCVHCIINDFITEECKSQSLYSIKNMDMFLKPKNCFFCRKSNIYKQLNKDNECQSIFIDIIRDKILKDTLLRIQHHMNEITENVSQ